MNSYIRSLKNSLALVMLLIAQFTFCQNIKNERLKWTVSGLSDLRTNESADYRCTFISDGSDNIQWIQKNGSFINTLKVIGTNGTWDDVKEDGQITFTISFNDEGGTIRFKRSDSAIEIVLDLSPLSESRLYHRYKVEQVITAD